MQTSQIILVSHPVGSVKESDLACRTAPVAEPGDGQVLVEVAYLSLDPAIRYWLNAADTYMPGARIGEPVRCFAGGTITTTRHADFPVGTYVTGLLSAQSHIVTDGKGLVRCDLADGSASWHLGVLGMPGMTAYFGLLERARPVAGDTLFVSGAAGTVGTMVGQIAKIHGCRVVGSAGSDEKCAWLVDEMGFDAAFNYKTESPAVALKRLCPAGMNIYFDNVGGDMLDAALLNLARGARVVICGALSQYNEGHYAGPRNYMKLLTARATMNGIIVFDFFEQWQTAARQIAAWLKAGRLKSVEHIESGIARFPAALIDLYAGKHVGKVLVKI